jgi:hypothetical protein
MVKNNLKTKLNMSFLKKNNSGSTMVETLVSFVILFLILASLYGIVAFSSELYMRSVDTSRLLQRFTREINKKDELIGTGTDPFIKKEEYKAGYTKAGSDGNFAALELTLVVDDTNSSFTGSDAMKNSRIKLNNTATTTYVCNDSTFEEKKIIVPKAIRYEYEHD